MDLKIKDITTNDYGPYACTVTNSMGHSKKYMVLGGYILREFYLWQRKKKRSLKLKKISIFASDISFAH